MNTAVNPPAVSARIDWECGAIVGHSVPPDDAAAFDVVRLLLDGQCVASEVARRSAFDPALVPALAGLALPAREASAFALRIPAGRLPPAQLACAGVTLRVETARGTLLLEQRLEQLHELLRLCELAPLEQLFRVQFSHVEAGRVHGLLVDLHASGLRPALFSRLNDTPPQPLGWLDAVPMGSEHAFAVPLDPQALHEGVNRLVVCTEAGQPLASYPIELGARLPGETDRRLAVLEAEVAFLKHLALNPLEDGLSARLAAFRSELVNLCSDMLMLQRTQLEREIRHALGDGTPPPR